jgi:hypothetical protein
MGTMDQRSPLPLHVRSTLIRYASIAGVVLFMAMTTFVRWKDPLIGAPGGLEPLTWAAIAVAVGGFLGSRAVARLPTPSEAEKAMTRMVVQLAICEVGGLLGAVAWFLTGNTNAWFAVAISVFGMVLVRPVRGPAQGNASSRMIR